MISGILIPFIALSLNASNPADLGAALATVAQQTPETLAFVETRESEAFETPLELTGTLTFDPPERIIKRVETPYRELTTVEARSVTVERRSRERFYPLARAPALAALVEALRSLMSGEVAKLEALFELDWQPADDGNWTLVMKPIDSELAAKIEQLVVHSRGGLIASIETRWTNGERAKLALEPVESI